MHHPRASSALRRTFLTMARRTIVGIEEFGAIADARGSRRLRWRPVILAFTYHLEGGRLATYRRHWQESFVDTMGQYFIDPRARSES